MASDLAHNVSDVCKIRVFGASKSTHKSLMSVSLAEGTASDL